MKEFIDKFHPTSNQYFSIMDRFTGKNAPYIVPRLKKLIQKDPTYFEPYNSLVDLLMLIGEESKAINYINLASQKALTRIVDRKGNWPERLKWSILGNRHIIKAILNRAILYWDEGQSEEALDLFRKLLQSNPNDNIGARDFILAIRMNMTFDQFEQRFNKGGFYDSDLIEWFEKNYKTFPNEFKWCSRNSSI